MRKKKHGSIYCQKCSSENPQMKVTIIRNKGGLKESSIECSPLSNSFHATQIVALCRTLHLDFTMYILKEQQSIIAVHSKAKVLGHSTFASTMDLYTACNTERYSELDRSKVSYKK